MSTGFSFDMILLLIKGPRRPRHHASPPKKRRGQHRHRPTATARSSPHVEQATVQEPTAPRAEATVTMASHAMASGSSVPRAPSPPSALLPHGLFAARRTYLFGLDNAVTSLARAICPGTGTCVERPLVLPRDAGTRQQAQQVARQLDFPRICGPRRLGPGRCWAFLTSLPKVDLVF